MKFINMKRIKGIGSIGLLLIGTALWAPQAKACGEQLTYFTFNAPVEIPGKALPAGSYVFRLVAKSTTCDTIQILNPDQTRVYATVMTKAVYVRYPPDRTVLTFAERPANTPEAVDVWVYPLTREGHRFIYTNKISRKPPHLEFRPSPAGVQ